MEGHVDDREWISYHHLILEAEKEERKKIIMEYREQWIVEDKIYQKAMLN